MEADIWNPRKYGFDSSYTPLSQITPIEQQLFQRNFEFAAYLRSIRLKNPFNEEIKRLYWTLFTVNLGILLIYVPLIDAICKKHNFEYIGFCGRDAYHVYQLYKKFKQDKNEPMPTCDYLHFSRTLFEKCIEDVRKYYANRIGDRKALLIDLLGSGRHLCYMREKIKSTFSIMFGYWGGYKAAAEAYPKWDIPKNWTNIRDGIKFESEKNIDFYVINSEEFKEKLNTNDWEMFNRATHNSPIRLKAIKIANKIIPEVIFKQSDDTEYTEVFQTCIKEVLNSKIEWITFNENKIEEMVSLMKFLLISFLKAGEPIFLRSKYQLAF